MSFDSDDSLSEYESEDENEDVIDEEKFIGPKLQDFYEVGKQIEKYEDKKKKKK